MVTNQDWYTMPSWITQIVTPEAIHNALVRHVPEFASGELNLVSCEAKRLRFQSGEGRWTGTYLLTVERVPSEPRWVVSIHATLTPPASDTAQAISTNGIDTAVGTNGLPFGTREWQCFLPELHLTLRTQQGDAGLAMLPQLTEPEQARQLLEESIRTEGRQNGNESVSKYSDFRIQSCKPNVMRYKPGSRCTILYDLEYAPEDANQNWPEVIVAKTYNDNKGQIAHVGMEALWHSPLGSSSTVTIAEPLAYLPEENVLIQGPIREEMTLKELVRKTLKKAVEPGTEADLGELGEYIRKTAKGLAELHQCGADCGETVTWEDELAEIYQRRAGLASALPQLADLAEDTLEHLQRLAAEHPTDPSGPAHQSFRPAQVLLHNGEIGFIDFDGFCQAEPAMDVALFITTIKSLALGKSKSSPDKDAAIDTEQFLARLGHAEAICELFLTEYEKHAPISRTRILLWETLNLLTLVLNAWAKLKPAKLEVARLMLEQHLANKMIG